NKYVRQVLETNPYYSNLYDILAENSVSLRHYKEAVAFARQAPESKPTDWNGLSIFCVNPHGGWWGEDGKAAIGERDESDSFNQWTYNTLMLLDSFEHFVRFDTAHFKVKLHEKEVAVMRPYVAELLEKAYGTLTDKYGFKPEGPINFEMYPDHDDFGVRTLK